MRYTFPFELPSLNEYVNAERANRFAGAKMKKDIERRLASHILHQGVVAHKIPVRIDFIWKCKNKRKDKDNIAFSKKFLLDSLVRCGVIPNDKWDCIESWIDIFPEPDKEDVGVDVIIYEKGDDDGWT